jgi:hypothetical protein
MIVRCESLTYVECLWFAKWPAPLSSDEGGAPLRRAQESHRKAITIRDDARLDLGIPLAFAGL